MLKIARSPAHKKSNWHVLEKKQKKFVESERHQHKISKKAITNLIIEQWKDGDLEQEVSALKIQYWRKRKKEIRKGTLLDISNKDQSINQSGAGFFSKRAILTQWRPKTASQNIVTRRFRRCHERILAWQKRIRMCGKKNTERRICSKGNWRKKNYNQDQSKWRRGRYLEEGRLAVRMEGGRLFFFFLLFFLSRLQLHRVHEDQALLITFQNGIPWSKDQVIEIKRKKMEVWQPASQWKCSFSLLLSSFTSSPSLPQPTCRYPPSMHFFSFPSFRNLPMLWKRKKERKVFMQRTQTRTSWSRKGKGKGKMKTLLTLQALCHEDMLSIPTRPFIPCTHS